MDAIEDSGYITMEQSIAWAKQDAQRARKQSLEFKAAIREGISPVLAEQARRWSRYRKERETADPLELMAELSRWIRFRLPVTFEVESRSDVNVELRCKRLTEADDVFEKSLPRLLSVHYPRRSEMMWLYTDEIRRPIRDVFVAGNGRSSGGDPSRVVKSGGTFMTEQYIHVLTD